MSSPLVPTEQLTIAVPPLFFSWALAAVPPVASESLVIEFAVAVPDEAAPKAVQLINDVICNPVTGCGRVGYGHLF